MRNLKKKEKRTRKNSAETTETTLACPDGFHLGYKYFPVEEKDVGILTNADLGAAQLVGGKVHMDKNQGATEKANTLLHEVLHLGWGMSALSKSDKITEEAAVFVMANTVIELFNRNPEIMLWIGQCLAHDAQSGE